MTKMTKKIKEKIICQCGVSFPHTHRDCDGLKNPIPIEEPPQIGDWEKEFDKQFWTTRGLNHPDYSMLSIIKPFIRQLLAQARQEERQKMAGEIEKWAKENCYKDRGLNKEQFIKVSEFLAKLQILKRSGQIK